MQRIIPVIFLFFYPSTSFGQVQYNEKDYCDTFLYFQKTKSELLKYIANPCPNDSTCLSEISKAKSEVDAGKITVCLPLSLGSYLIRQERQLKELCKVKGLKFEYELFSCIGFQGQTEGCYGLYMDNVITQKFGKNFKETLLKKADSLYVKSNTIFSYENCDSLPHLKDKNFQESTNLNVAIKRELLDKIKISQNGYYPQVEIGFIIDTAGIPSKYSLSQFYVYDDIKENYKFKNELTKIAFDYIKKFTIWEPGIILNRKVKTKCIVTICFIRENSE